MATIEATSEEVRGNAPASPPPRENLIRALRPGLEIRETSGAVGPVMTGHFAVFNEWTEIDSWYEGRFLERIAPGSFRKTFAENRDNIKVTLNHGFDPVAGDKPLGTIDVLEEDKIGARYEVPLLDARYVTEDILPGLRAGLYGASFRFRVMAEEFVNKPKTSAANPEGLPERTIKEIQLMEFGPVTFPAYASATAGIRSLTDEFVARSMIGRYAKDPGRLLTPMGMRFDAEDTGTLAQMIALAAEYLDEQDETDDAADITAMQGVVSSLTTLLQSEAAEIEPPETDQMNSKPEPSGATTRGTEPEPSAATTHSDRGLFWFAETPKHLRS